MLPLVATVKVKSSKEMQRRDDIFVEGYTIVTSCRTRAGALRRFNRCFKRMRRNTPRPFELFATWKVPLISDYLKLQGGSGGRALYHIDIVRACFTYTIGSPTTSTMNTNGKKDVIKTQLHDHQAHPVFEFDLVCGLTLRCHNVLTASTRPRTREIPLTLASTIAWSSMLSFNSLSVVFPWDISNCSWARKDCNTVNDVELSQSFRLPRCPPHERQLPTTKWLS